MEVMADERGGILSVHFSQSICLVKSLSKTDGHTSSNVVEPHVVERLCSVCLKILQLGCSIEVSHAWVHVSCNSRFREEKRSNDSVMHWTAPYVYLTGITLMFHHNVWIL